MATASTSEGPTPSEVTYFESQVHLFLTDPTGTASAEVTRLQHSSPPSHRAHYTHLLAEARSARHKSVAETRRDHLDAALSETLPNAALECKDLTSAGAKSTRARMFAAFVAQHAQRGNVGTQPFFRALKSLFELQARGEEKRGAGGVCLEWTFDEAVLMEAGGEAFARESVGCLIGVLGFLTLPFTRPADPTQPSLRTWRLPSHLTDPELRALARAIPSRYAPLHPVRFAPARQADDLEQAGAGEEEEVKVATGMLRRSLEPREEGYKGSALERIVGWLCSFIL